MSLADIVRNGVALAHSITNDGELQETVTLRRWRADDSHGVRTYATAITSPAIVTHKRKHFRNANGEDTVSTAQVTFLEPLAALAPAVTGRKNPVDERDLLTLANGETAPILGTDGGLSDPDTSLPYVLTVFLG